MEILNHVIGYEGIQNENWKIQELNENVTYQNWCGTANMVFKENL